MHKKLKDMIYYIFIFIGAVLFYVIWANFPAHLIINAFTKELTREQIMAEDMYWGEVAGMPAGDDIPLENDLNDLSDATNKDYMTFVTDDIVPLGVYQLKSIQKDGVYYLNSSNRATHANGRRRAQYVTGSVIERYLYNEYYLVKLPGGDYALAYLDDCYYWKYCIFGKVQLPIGSIMVLSNGIEPMKYLKEQDEILEKYHIDLESDSWGYYLLMFNEEHYEKYSNLYCIICLVGAGIFVMVYGVVIGKIFGDPIDFKKMIRDIKDSVKNQK
ncbi:MAG: hypothetical protein ACI4AQ_02640 [Lachnospiraceae bacterium]